MTATQRRLTAEARQDAIAAFAEHTGYDADGCQVLYRDDLDTGRSYYQVVDAQGRGDGSGEWTEIESWCVAGQEPDGPWEPCQGDFATEQDAIDWLKENAVALGERHGYAAFYVDREANDGHAENYYDLIDGELVWTN